MGTEFFTLHRLPDLTLAQYSAEESGGVEDVVRQHASFYRQINRKGMLFGEVYHLIYIFNPEKQPGQRLQVYFGADGNESGQEPACMEQFMEAAPLATYFRFKKETPDNKTVFRFRATLAKQDGFVSSSQTENETGYYTVNPWKPNEKARLIGLFRMMQRLGRPAAYAVTMNAVDQSERMRSSFRQQIQFIRNIQKQNQGIRDENAEQCIRIYEKLFESLRSNPHFRCRISAYANHPDLAKMILDAAASEAVEEGSYRIVTEDGEYQPLIPDRHVAELCNENTPRGMREWNSLFLLKELVPFVMFPILYSGENIEIPKESSPIYEKTGLYLGNDNNGYEVYLPLGQLTKHALLAGVPGSGKTYSMLHLSSQLAGRENNIPILVLEPAKKEYRALARNEDIPELLVFSPGAPGSFPLRINPFEFPIGLKLSEHITALNQVFEGAFDLTPPMPFLVSEAIEQVYRDHGWYPFEINDGEHTYPSIRELYDKIAELLDASDYAPEIKSNLKSCLQVRIGSLVSREMGNVFNVAGSTISPEEWLKTKCVIELESLGADAANFLTLLLLTIIRELLRQNPKAGEDKPRHVIFLEEAHNLIGPTTVSNAENGDAKVASTKYIVDMLAEVRALHEAIIIADQLPTGLAPQVTKNTSLKIGHRITAMDDRELLASTMSADGIQLERMASFRPGHALCVYEDVQKPFEIQIAKYKGETEAPGNEELFDLQKSKAVYQQVMTRDRNIMEEKFRVKKEKIRQAVALINQGAESIQHDLEYLNSREAAPTKPELMKLRGKEAQQERRIKELAVDWLEYLLEYMDYYKMNRLYIHPYGSSKVGREFSEFHTELHRFVNEKSMEKILERAKKGMEEFINVMKQVTKSIRH